MKKLYLLSLLIAIANLIYSQGSAGSDKTICKGSSVIIGSTTDDPKFCYSWKASPADPSVVNLKTAKITVSPSQTTVYTLTVVGQDFSSLAPDDVVVNVIENSSFTSSNATIADGAAPSIPLASNVWGFTYPETVEVEITACSDGTDWHATVLNIKGNYSEQVRLLSGVQEVTGIGGNTTLTNFCDQVTDLGLLTLGANNWFMQAAVRAHEDVHATRFEPALEAIASQIEILLEKLSVKDNGQTQQDALNQIKSLADYNAALTQAQQLWLAEILIRVANDHQGGAGPTYVAEHLVLDPMIMSICNYAKAQSWATCAVCK